MRSIIGWRYAENNFAGERDVSCKQHQREKFASPGLLRAISNLGLAAFSGQTGRPVTVASIRLARVRQHHGIIEPAPARALNRLCGIKDLAVRLENRSARPILRCHTQLDRPLAVVGPHWLANGVMAQASPRKISSYRTLNSVSVMKIIFSPCAGRVENVDILASRLEYLGTHIVRRKRVISCRLVRPFGVRIILCD